MNSLIPLGAAASIGLIAFQASLPAITFAAGAAVVTAILVLMALFSKDI